MTNLELIVQAAVVNKLYTEQEVIELLETRGELPLHTFQAWKRKGYSVKKGEKATIVTQLWKYRTVKIENEEGEEEESGAYRLCKSYLFTAEQVEKIA